jgi:hypothetical protein
MRVNWQTVFDVARGAVIGILLCYAFTRLVGIDPESLVFRYAGY